jgi:hypothetical protein
MLTHAGRDEWRYKTLAQLPELHALTYAHVCSRMLTYAGSDEWRYKTLAQLPDLHALTYADVC